jgi:quercetin dioxygenase-like cupin family protein
MDGRERVPEYIQRHGPLDTPYRLTRLRDELAELEREPAWAHANRLARTLTKHGPLRMVLVRLRAGAQLAEHDAGGPVTIHCVMGSVRVLCAGQAFSLAQGDILTLDEALKHSVDALDDAALLLTIAR